MDSKLRAVGLTGKELDFKLGILDRIINGVGMGWNWLKSKLEIINAFLGSLSSAGVLGADALAEIKNAYEAAKKEEE